MDEKDFFAGLEFFIDDGKHGQTLIDQGFFVVVKSGFSVDEDRKVLEPGGAVDFSFGIKHPIPRQQLGLDVLGDIGAFAIRFADRI